MSLAALGGGFQAAGDAGNQVATGILDAHRRKIQDLFDQLALQQGGVQLEESKARMKQMQQPGGGTEDPKIMAQFAALKKIFPNASDEELRRYFKMQDPKPPAAAKVNSPFELWKQDHPDGTYEQWKKESEKTPPAAKEKTVQKQTYDPSGHLRFAAVDSTTEEVVGWGPLVPQRAAFDKYTDLDGNIHSVPKPTMQKVNPGEILMSDKAMEQWKKLAGPEHQPFQTKLDKSKKDTPKPGSDTAPSSTKLAAGDHVIGHTAPKDIAGTQIAVKSAQAGYTTWVRAQANAADNSPKSNLAIVFDAVRSSVEGAGRLNNSEIQNEIAAGSLGDKWKRTYDMAATGKLPPDQLQALLNVIRNSWAARANTAREAWKSSYGDRPMPKYIQDPDDLSGLGPGQ